MQDTTSPDDPFRAETGMAQSAEGFVLGGMEDAVYRTERIVLDLGDRILLYTDGVTEAMNRRRPSIPRKD